MMILYKNQVVDQDTSVQDSTCLGFIRDSGQLQGWPLVKKELSASQSLRSVSTHVLYVTGGKRGCGRNGQAETDGEKPGGNQRWFLRPLFRLRKRTRAQLPTSMPQTEAKQKLCFFFLRRGICGCRRCLVSCPFFFLRKKMLRVVFNLLSVDTIFNKQTFLREKKVSTPLLRNLQLAEHSLFFPYHLSTRHLYQLRISRNTEIH